MLEGIIVVTCCILIGLFVIVVPTGWFLDELIELHSLDKKGREKYWLERSNARINSRLRNHFWFWRTKLVGNPWRRHMNIAYKRLGMQVYKDKGWGGLVHKYSFIGKRAHIGRRSVIDKGSVIVEDAIVMGDSYVKNSIVCTKAHVTDSVISDSILSEQAKVMTCEIICSDISGDCFITGGEIRDSIVTGTANISGKPMIYDSVLVENSEVRGEARISYTYLFGGSGVIDNAHVLGTKDAPVYIMGNYVGGTSIVKKGVHLYSKSPVVGAGYVDIGIVGEYDERQEEFENDLAVHELQTQVEQLTEMCRLLLLDKFKKEV